MHVIIIDIIDSIHYIKRITNLRSVQVQLILPQAAFTP